MNVVLLNFKVSRFPQNMKQHNCFQHWFSKSSY